MGAAAQTGQERPTNRSRDPKSNHVSGLWSTRIKVTHLRLPGRRGTSLTRPCLWSNLSSVPVLCPCPLSALHAALTVNFKVSSLDCGTAGFFFWSGGRPAAMALCWDRLTPQLGFVIGSAGLKDALHHLTHLNACKMSNQRRVS